MTNNDPYFGSSLLSQEYVYYESLSYDGDPTHKRLYNQAKNSLEVLSGHNTQIETAATLAQMAAAERQKEIAFLTNVFGNINVSEAHLGNKNAGKIIIEAFNSTLGLKKAYDRNIARIMSDDGRTHQVDIASFFDSYIATQFNKYIGLAIYNAIRQFNTGKVDILVALENQVDKALNNAIDGAIEAALNSRTFVGIDSETDDAYQELLAYINNNMGAKDWLKTHLYHNYKLDQVKQYLMSEIKSDMTQQDRKKVYTDAKKKISNGVDRYRQGGFTREYLANIVSQMVIDGLSNAKGVSVNGTVHHTGKIGQMKADNILTFNIPNNIVNNAFNSLNGGGTREKNVGIIKELGEKLSNIDDGYIVYTSSKNYTINDGFKKRGGFNSGEEMSLKTFRTLLQDSPFSSHAYSMVGGIMQLLKGAVGYGRKNEYITAIARYIAYFLFDDIGIIGTNIKGSSPTALHLFDLDGIYIPLSFFLELLSDAFKSIQKTQPTDLVKVSIKGADKSIMYPWPQEYTTEMWHKQGEDALNTIKISAKFLADFKNIISNLR